MAATLPIPVEAVRERMNAMRISAEEGLGRVQSYVETNVAPLAKVVVAYRALLTDTGTRLVRAHQLVVRALAAKPGDPTLLALLRRTVELLTTWAAHANGYAQYERPASAAETGRAVRVGAAQAVVIAIAIGAAVIAVSVTGIAWAIVHYKEAQTLADEVALVEKDPSLADALARLNQSAPSSSPPDLPAPETGGWGWVVGAFGLVAAAIYFIPKFGKG
jgi:hypothetical protein